MALGIKVDLISTVSQGDSGGVVRTEPIGYVPTRKRLEDNAIVSFAGRAAEILLLGDASSGAQHDLEAATRCVAAIHGSLGLGASVLHRAPATDTARLLSNPDFSGLIEAELRILDARCTVILTSRLAALRLIAGELQAQRVLTGDDLQRLI
jgi:ATP-dependent Zn protease